MFISLCLSLCFLISLSLSLSHFPFLLLLLPLTLSVSLSKHTRTHTHKQTHAGARAVPQGDDEYPVWMVWIKNNINEKALIAVIYQPVQSWTPRLTDQMQIRLTPILLGKRVSESQYSPYCMNFCLYNAHMYRVQNIYQKMWNLRIFFFFKLKVYLMAAEVQTPTPNLL